MTLQFQRLNAFYSQSGITRGGGLTKQKNTGTHEMKNDFPLQCAKFNSGIFSLTPGHQFEGVRHVWHNYEENCAEKQFSERLYTMMKFRTGWKI